jgi:hypothetical protein
LEERLYAVCFVDNLKGVGSAATITVERQTGCRWVEDHEDKVAVTELPAHLLKGLAEGPLTVQDVAAAAASALEDRRGMSSADHVGGGPGVPYAPHISPLDEENGGGSRLARELWGDSVGPSMVAPVHGATQPTTRGQGVARRWGLAGGVRPECFLLSPRAFFVMVLDQYKKAGVHPSITSTSGILSDRLTCTAVHVEQALLGSMNLLTAGHPKVCAAPPLHAACLTPPRLHTCSADTSRFVQDVVCHLVRLDCNSCGPSPLCHPAS